VSATLRIGTRGSALALAQTEWARDRLQELHPGLEVEIRVIQTTGDKLLDAPLSKLGDKGLFTKELETAMLRGETDLAVHSAKDMPTEVPEGLEIVAFTGREDVRDVFVAGGVAGGGSPAGRPAGAARPGAPGSAAELPSGAVIGSSSLRRRSQLLALRPDLQLVDIRGNVQTRLRKVGEQGMAGTVLAAAGLARLGRPELAAFAFGFGEMLPAVGQGALALEARAGDERVAALVQPLAHRRSALAVRAERSLLRALQGGCQVPIAALAEWVSDEAGEDAANGAAGGRAEAGAGRRERLRLRAYVGSLDGADTVRLELEGPAADPEALGLELAGRLRAAGADRILQAVRAEAGGG
jgi:hydroxymethylbilane synthase